jgi:hypothetical protein
MNTNRKSAGLATWVRTLSFVAVALLGVGCGTPSVEAPVVAGGPTATPAGDKPNLVGKWESACVKNGDTVLKLSFDIGASDWKLDYATFGDAECKVPFLTVRIEGDYQVTAPAAKANPGWEGRFGFTKKTAKAHMQAASDFLVSAQGCGAGAFPIGAEVDLGQSGCAGLGQRPIASCKQDFDLVYLEGDTLAFGERPADNDMCTEAKRPTKKAGLVMARKR